MSRLEKVLWGADFMIAAIGYGFGGPMAEFLSGVIGAVLIFIGLTTRDGAEKSKAKIVVDHRNQPYKGTTKIQKWHKVGLGFSLVILIIIFARLLQNKAKVNGHFHEVALQSLPDGRQMALVSLSITNRGEPTTLRSYRIQIIVDSAIIEEEHPSVLPNEGLSVWDAQGNVKTYQNRDTLVEKTATVPISTGATVTGPLLFYLRENLEELIATHNGTLKILCKDYSDKDYEFSAPLTKFRANNQLRYFPGEKTP